MRRAGPALFGLLVTLALVIPGTAEAASPPACGTGSDEIWARPGFSHTSSMACPGADSVTIATQPEHGYLSGPLLADGRFSFSFHANSLSPTGLDSFTLHVTGAGGTSDVAVAVHIMPTTVNTAPTCTPVSIAAHTDGLSPFSAPLSIYCRDAEHDQLTIHGGGPGMHGFDPLTPVSADDGAAQAWAYRTAALSGVEHSSYWAEDVLGAVSAPAEISVAFGPGVAATPTCVPLNEVAGARPWPIYARPGAVRRFELVCADAAGTTFAPQLGTPPSHGAITALDVGPARSTWLGLTRSVDVTYTPATTYEGDDQFAITTGALGPATGVRIITRPMWANRGGSCTVDLGPRLRRSGHLWSIGLHCTDDEGDPLTASVAVPPIHGTAGAPTSAPDGAGSSAIVVPYTSQATYLGDDTFTVRVTDGHGFVAFVPLTESLSPIAPIDRSGAPPTIGAGPQHVPADQLPQTTTADRLHTALEADHVRIIRKLGPVKVYAAQGKLRRAASQPALAVLCPVACSITASSRVSMPAGAQAATVLTAKADRPRPLTLHLSGRQLRAIRRAGGGTAHFRLRVTLAGGRVYKAADVALGIAR